MFKLSKLWPDLRRRADAPHTFQAFRQSKLWLGVALRALERYALHRIA